MHPNNTWFKVWPQGTVDYLIWVYDCGSYSCGWSPFHLGSGAAGVDHTVNSN